MYVLSVLTTKHHDSYNPLDVNAWEFYVLPRAAVAELNVESLGLVTVARLTHPVSYAGLANAVRAASTATERSQ